jgi:two-component system, response regulator YesN
MYKFLMVDDEEIVRRGFRKKIDWDSLGFEFLEPCENGREAIEAIERLHPDVVMTDIYMPHVDGLAVAAHAAAHHPEVVIVILSGYDEFEYARKAIANRVFEYVLKPVTSRELTSLLVKLKARLDADRRSRRDESALKERADIGEGLLRSRTLLDLVTGALIVSEEVFHGLFGFSPRGLACAAIVAKKGSADAELFRVIETAVQPARHALSFSPGEDREAILVFEPNAQACDRVTAAIARNLAAAGDHPPTVGAGRTYESWVDAPRTFEEATSALAYRLVSGPGKPFHYTQAREDNPACLEELKSSREMLCRAAVSGDAEETNARTAAFQTLLVQAELSPQRVRHEISALFAGILDAFGDLGVSPSTVSHDLGVDYDRTVERLRTTEETKDLLMRLSAYAGSVLAQRNIPAPRWKVLDFKAYVARHYGEQNLSVQKVAESLAISASYLSKLIKRHLDTSFVDYLTDFRLARAKELLATTDLMTYEISEAAGYPDAHYFSSIFKKRFGITPSEFREEGRKRQAHP